MTEFEVIRKDAIRLATVVVNLSKKYKPFQARVGSGANVVGNGCGAIPVT
jgi:hypothetical protein